MGRKSIKMELISNEKERRNCFRKRRINVVKKLMQLCQLTGCKVDLKIYSQEENSLLAYASDSSIDTPTFLDSYLKIQNKDISSSKGKLHLNIDI